MPPMIHETVTGDISESENFVFREYCVSEYLL